MLPIDKINNIIKQQVIAVLSTFTQTRIGIISGYDPNTYTSKVTLQPDGLITNYLPIVTFNVGIGWGFYSAPRAGDMVMVHFQEGDLSTGFITGSIFNSIDTPVNPGPPEGETWMIHKTGTFLKFKNDGTISITALDSNSNPTNININGNIVLTGNITATGDILDQSGTNTNNMRLMRSIYDSHTHGGVMAGGSNTLDPNQPM
jgi:phage baseplate assembly protein gpV